MNFEEAFDHNASLTQTIFTPDPKTGLNSTETFEISQGSEKWNKFAAFLHQNSDGWQSSPASFTGDMEIKQDNFSLFYNKRDNFVVVNFADADGNPKQYIKSISPNTLDFLTE